jgi:hypothetical protein
MVRVLEASGLVQAVADPAGGNRRQLTLTPEAMQLVEHWGGLLEQRLAALADAGEVPYATYVEHTKRLLRALDADTTGTSRPPLTSSATRARSQRRP